jgi:hypothetical protein
MTLLVVLIGTVPLLTVAGALVLAISLPLCPGHVPDMEHPNLNGRFLADELEVAPFTGTAEYLVVVTVTAATRPTVDQGIFGFVRVDTMLGGVAAMDLDWLVHG